MIHATTILAVRHRDAAVLAGDGQVTLGAAIVKHGARKIRRLYNESILAGFAGSAADSFALFSRFEAKLEQYRGNLERAAVELAKDWRTDRALRRLEAMLVIVDKKSTFLLSGTGDLIEPDDGIIGIGSGGAFAQAAAKALVQHSNLERAGHRERVDAHRVGDLRLHQQQRDDRGTVSVTPVIRLPERTHTRDRFADAARNRRRARQARRRPEAGEAGRRHRVAQPHAAAEAAAGARRRGRAEEHPDDRPDRRRQDRNRAAPGEAGAVAVPESRGVEIHRGRLRRPRRRVDGARPGRDRRRHGARRADARGPRQGAAERRGAPARSAPAAAAAGAGRRLERRSARRSQRTRERLREQLRDGRFDDRVVEIEVRDKAFPSLEIITGANVEEVEFNIKDMMPGLFQGTLEEEARPGARGA